LLVRSLIFYLVFYSTLIPISIVVIFSSIIFSMETTQKVSGWWVLNILKALKLICLISWKVEGEENIPKKPCLIVANHHGPWESLFLQTLFVPTSSIIKKEILLIPFFGWAISCLKPITINRNKKLNSLKRVVQLGGKRIIEGYMVLIFPEGTRGDPSKGIGKFGNSFGMLAAKHNVPVIPICHNSGKYWVNKSIKKNKGCISVKVGSPITGSNPKEISDKAYQWIKKSYKDIN